MSVHIILVNYTDSDPRNENGNNLSEPAEILAAFGQFLGLFPETRLYMVYHAAPLLNAVRALIAARPSLQAAVYRSTVNPQ